MDSLPDPSEQLLKHHGWHLEPELAFSAPDRLDALWKLIKVLGQVAIPASMDDEELAIAFADYGATDGMEAANEIAIEEQSLHNLLTGARPGLDAEDPNEVWEDWNALDLQTQVDALVTFVHWAVLHGGLTHLVMAIESFAMQMGIADYRDAMFENDARLQTFVMTTLVDPFSDNGSLEDN